MLTSLALIFLVGLAAAALCQRLRLPRLIGMLVTGIVLGPFALDLLDPSILGPGGAETGGAARRPHVLSPGPV